MKNSSKKLLGRIISLMICAVLCLSSMSITVSAEYNSTINLANVQQNVRGNGYYWNNPDRILTLDGFSLTTSDDFGLKLPENATVELVGTNRISAAKYALSSAGGITFIGKGTLIIESNDIGLYSYSNVASHKIRVTDGKLKISGKNHAIVSENAEITVTGGTLEVSSEAEYAIDSRVFAATGGEVVAKGAIRASHLLRINSASVEVSAHSGAALIADNLLDTEYIKLMVGNDSSSLSKAESYNGERYVTTVALSKGPRASILFGEGTPITVDYILLTLAILLFAAAIVVPILRKRNKTKKLYEALEAEKADKISAKNKK